MSTGSTNATVTPTPQIVYVTVLVPPAPPTTPSIVDVSTTPTYQNLQTVVTIIPTVTTKPTIEQPDEKTLASLLTISGTGSNYQSDTTGYVSVGNMDCTYSKSGTIFIYGTVDSSSKYTLKVDLEADIIDAPVKIQNTKLTDSIIVHSFGTTGFQFGASYTNGNCIIGTDTGSYNVYITGVSIVPTN